MMFELTEEQRLIRDAARDFAIQDLLPGVIYRDTHQEFPSAEIRKLGELGFLGMMVSPAYRGAGMDALSYALAMEEIAKVDASTAVILSVNNSLVCYALERYGNAIQKEKYLAPLAAGEQIGAFCLSEPGSGSDAACQQTTAKDRGDHFLVNGTKNWITSGSSASIYIVFAQSQAEMGSRGINAFILEKGCPGFSVGAKEDKMGVRGSDTHSLHFTDVRLPKENQLGAGGEGFAIAMSALDGGRIGIAAQAVGIASGAYELALRYAKQRQSFGKPLIAHQAIQFKLADMATEIDAARLLLWRAAWLKDQGRPFAAEAAKAKLFASEVAMRVTTEAVQVHGGYGYVKEYHVERMMRDAKVTQIYEGTSEIQRLVIARSISR